MERALRIQANDGVGIYARLREIAEAPIVVLVHGSDESMHSALQTNFSRRLFREGFSCLRFNSYDFADDARKKYNVGLHEQLDDLGDVIEYARAISDRVFVVAHSFGGTCLVLRGTEGIDGGVLWDPAPQRDYAGKPPSGM